LAELHRGLVFSFGCDDLRATLARGDGGEAVSVVTGQKAKQAPAAAQL
jgi:hypothetical protein